MSGFDGAWVEILGGSLEEARAVMRDLDDAELPAGLRRVAAYQGGRLPPPLAHRLLKEIDQNDWFRAKVAEKWEGEEGDPATLFLLRPSGWWLELAGLVAGAEAARDTERIAELEARLGEADAKRQQSAAKAKELKRVVDQARRSAKESVQSAKQRLQERLEQELAAAANASSELTAAHDRLAELAEDHRALQDAFASLRTRFAKQRKGKTADSKDVAASSWIPTDPVRLARLLDLQTAEFGRDLSEPEQPVPVVTEPTLLPAGIRPDGADAIRWLLDLETPLTVLVDGYNAQFYVDSRDFTSGAARRHLIDALQRLRAAATVKHRVVVVYDSTLPGGRDPRTSVGGVEVRFAEEDRIADEEIVDMTSSLDPVVVITSDRAVREGAERNGAVVLWSEALVRWLERD